MKKIVLGTALGATVGIALACLAKAAYERGYFDSVSDSMHNFAFKTKKKFKNAVDTGKNEIEYLQDKAEYEIGKHKRKRAGVASE